MSVNTMTHSRTRWILSFVIANRDSYSLLSTLTWTETENCTEHVSTNVSAVEKYFNL